MSLHPPRRIHGGILGLAHRQMLLVPHWERVAKKDRMALLAAMEDQVTRCGERLRQGHSGGVFEGRCAVTNGYFAHRAAAQGAIVRFSSPSSRCWHPTATMNCEVSPAVQPCWPDVSLRRPPRRGLACGMKRRSPASRRSC